MNSVINKMLANHVYLIFLFEENLALNNLQWLKCHKTNPKQTNIFLRKKKKKRKLICWYAKETDICWYKNFNYFFFSFIVLNHYTLFLAFYISISLDRKFSENCSSYGICDSYCFGISIYHRICVDMPLNKET